MQVRGRDFALDLLFFHRGLNCLVAIELKVDRFELEHLGKLNFYLEGLDRDMRKPHENPAIGVLLCASKDSEMEYALSRAPSPALVAQHHTQLPDKQLLAAKRHEFYNSNAPHTDLRQTLTRPRAKEVRRARYLAWRFQYVCPVETGCGWSVWVGERRRPRVPYVDQVPKRLSAIPRNLTFGGARAR